MKNRNTNSDDLLREFTVYGLALAIFVFIGGIINSEKDDAHADKALHKKEFVLDLNAVASKLPVLPDFTDKISFPKINSYVSPVGNYVYGLYFNNIVNLKIKDCISTYLKYKPTLLTFIAVIKDLVFEPETPVFL